MGISHKGIILKLYTEIDLSTLMQMHFLNVHLWVTNWVLSPLSCHITPLKSSVKLKSQMKSPQYFYAPAAFQNQDCKHKNGIDIFAALSPDVVTPLDCQGCTLQALHSRTFLDLVLVPILPTSFCYEALCCNHDAPSAGHQVLKKILHQIHQEAYWVGIAADVNKSPLPSVQEVSTVKKAS